MFTRTVAASFASAIMILAMPFSEAQAQPQPGIPMGGPKLPICDASCAADWQKISDYFNHLADVWNKGGDGEKVSVCEDYRRVISSTTHANEIKGGGLGGKAGAVIGELIFKC